MSQYFAWDDDWKMPADGLYQCIDFKKYWEDKNSYPFLIFYQDELAGFAIIDKKGSDPKTDFNMAQFYIIIKYKNKGLGRHVAEMCFKQFPGKWEVMVKPGNEGAYRFWRAVIKKYTGEQFVEVSCEIPHFNNNPYNIFKFENKND
jgi:predicted acetyltransferase